VTTLATCAPAALTDASLGQTVISTFLNIVERCGLPQTTLTDNGSVYTSQLSPVAATASNTYWPASASPKWRGQC
jgi:hypothetical protein